MDGHIDWLSFTLETDREPVDAVELYHLSRSLLEKHGGVPNEAVYSGRGFEQTLSRTPYRVCLERDDHGCRLYGDSPTSTVLYELSGRGCEVFRSWEDARAVASALYYRVSRLDYAVDILTPTQPSDFANARKHRAFRTVSFIRSDTGETVYIGSPKSDRFARVYRYRNPHPRAHLLRVEFVFRRGLARIAAEDLANSEDQRKFEAKLGETWGWSHRDWKPGFRTDERIKTPSTTQKEEDTVMWLYKQVAPAMRRLLVSGALDLTDFLSHVFEEGGATQ